MNVYTSMPFIRILPAFCFGIALAFLDLLDNRFIILFLTVIVIGLIVIQTNRKFHFKLRYIRGILIALVYFSLGYLLTFTRDERNSENYFSHFNSVNCYRAEVVQVRQAVNRKVRLLVSMREIRIGNEWKQVIGLSFVYLPLDSMHSIPSTGDEILFSGRRQEISPPLNPGQFDFKSYAEVLRVYYRFSVDKNCWTIIPYRSGIHLKRFAENLRDKFLAVYQRAGLKGQEYAVLSALVLGYDDEIDKETMQAFSASGTLHILSVSGMHVGIIFSALTGILFFMERTKPLRIVRFVILICGLWFYALLTGFSPSVIRSATMFSFILIGRSLSRTSSIYNSLALSACCIFIFIDPLLLFNKGFQLSFLAVWGIAFFYDRLYKVVSFNFWLADKTWSLTAVSIAAQLSTFALSIYYFHQFPNYFILANLLIVPLSTCCIFSGILLLFISPAKSLSLFFGNLLESLVSLLNEVAVSIECLPFAVWNGITISQLELILIYVILFALAEWFDKKSAPFLLRILFLLNALFASISTLTIVNFTKDYLIIFSGTNGLNLQRVRGFDSWLFLNPDDSTKAKGYSDAFCLNNGMTPKRRRIYTLKAEGNVDYDGAAISTRNYFLMEKFLIKAFIDIKNPMLISNQVIPDITIVSRNIAARKMNDNYSTRELICTGDTLFWNKSGFKYERIYSLKNGARKISFNRGKSKFLFDFYSSFRLFQ